MKYEPNMVIQISGGEEILGYAPDPLKMGEIFMLEQDGTRREYAVVEVSVRDGWPVYRVLQPLHTCVTVVRAVSS